MEKKTICLVTNWYPTPENPYRGVFFKEQAFALKEKYDFLILRYEERKQMKVKERFELSKCNEEENTVEYKFIVNVPKLKAGADFVSAARSKVSGNNEKNESKRIEYIKEVVAEAVDKNFKDAFDYLYCVESQKEAFLLEAISKVSGKPYIVGEHAPFPWPGTIIEDYQKEAINNANAYLAISYDKIRQIMLQGVKLPKTFYIGNLIDENRYKLIDSSKGKVKTLLIIAAYNYYKNYDLFINIIERLLEITNEPFKVLIVGYGSNKGYSENAEELEERIKKSKFSDRAELIREVPHDELNKIYERSDAFLMTSIQEGQPVSALEAACTGLPIFSTRCGGVEDYTDDSTGRIFNVNEVEKFALELKDFIEEKTVFDNKKIRENVVKRFGKEAFIKNFVEAFESVEK